MATNHDIVRVHSRVRCGCNHYYVKLRLPEGRYINVHGGHLYDDDFWHTMGDAGAWIKVSTQDAVLQSLVQIAGDATTPEIEDGDWVPSSVGGPY